MWTLYSTHITFMRMPQKKIKSPTLGFFLATKGKEKGKKYILKVFIYTEYNVL